jgi:hypothetical protein
MNKLFAAVIMVLATSVAWTQSSHAQDSPQKAVPVEFFACNWQDGKGMADLQKVIGKFNKYADNNDSGYSAWVLTAQFENDPEGAFDVGWLGSWPSMKAFGESQDNWMSKGRDVAMAFAEVIDCSGRHEMASSVIINAPDGPPGNGVVMFYACSQHDGKSGMDAVQAAGKYSASMKALGVDVSSWLFFPGMGAGNIDFDFWRVVGFNNYVELAAAAEVFINGGGWKKSEETLGAVASCSSPAVFDARVVRQGGS